jgi:ABC-type uncharacterized transport system permease subunit
VLLAKLFDWFGTPKPDRPCGNWFLIYGWQGKASTSSADDPTLLAVSNGLVLAGAPPVQTQGGADILMVSVRSSLVWQLSSLARPHSSKTYLPITLRLLLALPYKLFIWVALSSDTLRSIGFVRRLKLITALLVVIALVPPKPNHF